MENIGGAHLIMDDDTKVQSSQASDLASLNLTGSKGLESYSHNNDSEEKRGQDYGTTSLECEHANPRDGIRNEWRNLEVSYSDIKDLTDNFSDALVIGEGAFGKVYRAKLGGRMVAIKILDSKSTQGPREFFQEIEVLYKMRHPNLVNLVGACFEEVRGLVYEYLPNGSLEDCLKESPKILTWQMRTRIIYEICLALSYLHSKLVIHADLKPANVLLDANFKSKLSDFGLCRFLPEDMATARFLETSPMGTPGYMDPWFQDRCILRPGSDLYSLGITVLKLLTGMSPIGLGWKISQADKNLLSKMIDPTAGNWPFELAEEMVYWSLQCCYHNENSSKVLRGMSTSLEGMLAEIEALQGGRFKPGQTIRYGSRGLEPPSHDKDKKEVMDATNPPPSSSSSSEVDEHRGGGGGSGCGGGSDGGKLVQFDGPFVLRHNFFLRTDGVMWTSTYWTWYTVALDDGSQVAVKEIKDEFAKGQGEFEEEVNVLGKIRHANLLNLRAYFYDPKGRQKLLVFDSMPKGSLATFFHGRGPDTRIDWPTRLNIAIGIARGLNYLHKGNLATFFHGRGPDTRNDWSTRLTIAIGKATGLNFLHNDMSIIHGNLSSANIFLDDDTNAKISDYELSRLITAPVNSNVIDTAGALGYHAPELSGHKKANTKTDVYSLGVILLELLTGKSPGESFNGLVLPGWVTSTIREEGVYKVFDQELFQDEGIWTKSQLTHALVVALDCVSSSPADRPEVQDVLQKLEKTRR